MICSFSSCKPFKKITTVEYGRAHQDEKNTNLTTEEYLNTVVNFIATNNTTPPAQLHRNKQISVYIKGYYTP